MVSRWKLEEDYSVVTRGEEAVYKDNGGILDYNQACYPSERSTFNRRNTKTDSLLDMKLKICIGG